MAGAVVTRTGLKIGKINTKGMSVLLPSDAKLDLIESFAGEKVLLTLRKSSIQSLPEGEVVLSDLDLDPQEVDDLNRADLITANQVVELKTADALVELTGWVTTGRAKKVMKVCKAALE